MLTILQGVSLCSLANETTTDVGGHRQEVEQAEQAWRPRHSCTSQHACRLSLAYSPETVGKGGTLLFTSLTEQPRAAPFGQSKTNLTDIATRI